MTQPSALEALNKLMRSADRNSGAAQDRLDAVERRICRFIASPEAVEVVARTIRCWTPPEVFLTEDNIMNTAAAILTLIAERGLDV